MTIVETLFIDVSNGEAMARAEMPVDMLPQSFEQETTMHIKDEDWTVIKAEPMTAEEFSQTGKLVLTLQKVVKVPVKNIIFTLPTICDVIPPVLPDSTRQGQNILELHEDDWRQIEFISVSYRSAIDFELAKIKSVYQDASVKMGIFLRLNISM